MLKTLAQNNTTSTVFLYQVHNTDEGNWNNFLKDAIGENTGIIHSTTFAKYQSIQYTAFNQCDHYNCLNDDIYCFLYSIEYKDRSYKLNYPLYFKIVKDEEGYLISIDKFDLYAGGLTTTLAIQDLKQMFDESYRMLLEDPDIDDGILGENLLSVKKSFKEIVNTIIIQ